VFQKPLEQLGSRHHRNSIWTTFQPFGECDFDFIPGHPPRPLRPWLVVAEAEQKSRPPGMITDSSPSTYKIGPAH
jgi:hypothetical protein